MQKFAIVGLSCLFPGADSPESFWDVLIQGRSTTSEATSLETSVDPAYFYDPDRRNLDSSYYLRGGYIGPFDFDATGYHIPPEQMQHLDRVYQWSLHVARGALQDSGHQGGPRTGVVLGNLSFPTRHSSHLFTPVYDTIYGKAIDELLGTGGVALPQLLDNVSSADGFSPGYPAALIAAALGLGGPYFALDAACASALYAVGLACKYLATGKADVMLAGSVSAADPLYVNIGFAHLGGYPEDGQTSRPLDTESGGLTSGEGAGMFVIKRHADAVRDGDHIYALVNGVGLSNDGSGKHILTPNSKGQILALERAYTTPLPVDYVECHASGTPVGDRTEMNTMQAFFGERNFPLIGSVKSNLGHLLTAAGMSSMTKLILSMAHNQIPATIGVEKPLILLDRIATAPVDWPPHPNTPRRAGVNAFGFGGVSAHLVLEANESQTVSSDQNPKPLVPIAITGMDAHFGPLDGLDAFAHSLYNGETALIPLPERRWKGLQHHPDVLRRFGLDTVPNGAYIDEFDLDFMHYRIPPNLEDEPIPQQLLMLKVADRALHDAGLQPGGNVAVIVAIGTELALHRYRGRADLNWQIEQALSDAGINLPPEQVEELRRINKDALLLPAQVNHYTSYIGNITASRIASLWDFSGPAFTVSAEENSTFRAIEIAQMLLSSDEIDAAVIGAVDLAGSLESVLMRQETPGEGAGAVVLTRADRVQSQSYAVIESLAFAQDESSGDLPGFPHPETVNRAAQLALEAAGNPAVDYLELSNMDAVDGLTTLYQGESLEVAVGSVQATIGNTYAAAGMAALIKTVLAASQRFLPAVPGWDSPAEPDKWRNTAFFVNTRSRTWFADRRVAAVNSLSSDGTAAHMILSAKGTRPNDYLPGRSPYLLPLSADTAGTLDTALADLLNRLDTQPVDQLADAIFAEFRPARYTLALVGRSSDEIRSQAEKARPGVAEAIRSGGVWATPTGSYFTARPVGPDTKIAFVYPGAFNAYPKLGYDLLHLFPQVYDDLRAVKADVGEAVAERRLYPRSQEKPGPRLTRSMKTALADDAVATITAGLSFALIYTRIMRRIFNVHPDSAFGYSLGEGSMMWGMGVWTDGDTGSANFKSSDLFTTRLVGPMNAVREAWGIAPDVPTDDFWTSYFIAAPAETVRQAADREPRVYLTHINTPNEVMIAGDPVGCQRVVDAVGGEHMRAPFSVVIHNDAMMSAYGEYYRLHDLPVTPVEGVTFYSAADYEPIKLDQRVIASSVARMVCKPVDFARLIERAYADGSRVFIELGPRSTCARWVDESLGQRDHVAVSIDNMGVDDHISIVRMLAQLVSHGVRVDLSPLYRPLPQTPARKQLIRSVHLGGQDIYQAIVSHKDNFADVEIKSPAPAAVEAQKMTAMPEAFSNVHADFLRSRQEALHQMGDLIRMQMQQPTAPSEPTTKSDPVPALPPVPAPRPALPPSSGTNPMYPFEKINQFAVGRVADCFGERYTRHDHVRAPRIPNGDLLLVSRVIDIQGERFKSVAGTSIHTEYDVPEDAWFYRDSPYPVMPYSVYMEIALQPCGFLSAYHGPTLDYPDIDFYFRNLDGRGTLYRDVDMRGRTITNHVTLLRNTILQGTIIQTFSFACYDGDELFYEGEATFGYFTIQALNSQAGLDTGKQVFRWLDTVDLSDWPVIDVNPHADIGKGYLRLGTGQLEFTDIIQVVPGGGKYEQGYAYAHTVIDPTAFYFACHFYQDPVMPGSIGVETIMQAMQAYAIESGLSDEFTHPRFAQTDGGHTIVWKYRGQILTDSEKSHVEANIKRIERDPGKITLYADASLWRDNLRIYEITDIALTITEA